MDYQKKKRLARESRMEWGVECVCVCVCVYEREKEREGKQERDIFLPSLYASSQIMPQYSQTSRENLLHCQGRSSALSWKAWSLCSLPALWSSNSPTEDCLSCFWILQNGSWRKPAWNLLSHNLDIICFIQMISRLAALIFIRAVLLAPSRSGMQRRQQTLWRALANVLCA